MMGVLSLPHVLALIVEYAAYEYRLRVIKDDGGDYEHDPVLENRILNKKKRTYLRTFVVASLPRCADSRSLNYACTLLRGSFLDVALLRNVQMTCVHARILVPSTCVPSCLRWRPRMQIHEQDGMQVDSPAFADYVQGGLGCLFPCSDDMD